MKRRGKAKKAPKREQSVLVSIRVTDEMDRYYRWLAKETGLSLSDVIRLVLQGKILEKGFDRGRGKH